MSFEMRFWAKVDRRDPDECWPWLAFIHRDGYGSFKLNGRWLQAHRVAYELVRGPIPAGLTLDHLCRNRACVNPWHLEPVTQRENVLRGMGTSALNARRTHCPKGHAYDEANTYRWRNHRKCRVCLNERHRLSYHARKLVLSGEGTTG